MLKSDYKYKISTLQHFIVTTHISVFQHTDTPLPNARKLFFFTYYVHCLLNIRMYFQTNSCIIRGLKSCNTEMLKLL